MLDRAIPFEAVVLETVEHVGDHVRNVAELGLAEAARRSSRGADADAAGLDRRQRVKGNAVLVAGDAGALEALVGVLAGEAERPKVDQREMRVGAAGDEVRAALLEAARSVLALAITALA